LGTVTTVWRRSPRRRLGFLFPAIFQHLYLGF
jgi:hypothetical protein